jgi:hypothetical protein
MHEVFQNYFLLLDTTDTGSHGQPDGTDEIAEQNGERLS